MNDIESERAPDSGDRRGRSGFGWIVAVELAILLFVGLGGAILTRGASAADPDHAIRVPTAVTVSLAALPTETADMYRYAAAHSEHFTQFPCYCGCDRSLGHRLLPPRGEVEQVRPREEIHGTMESLRICEEGIELLVLAGAVITRRVRSGDAAIR